MKKWLDKYDTGGRMQEHQPNFNEESVSMPKGFVGMGNDTKGRNYSPAWGGQFADGGEVDAATGPSKPSKLSASDREKVVSTALKMAADKEDISRPALGRKEKLYDFLGIQDKFYGNPCVQGVKTIFNKSGVDCGIPNDVYNNETFNKNYKNYGYEAIDEKDRLPGDILQYRYADEKNLLGLNNIPYHLGVYTGNDEYVSDGDKFDPIQKKNIYFKENKEKKDPFTVYRKKEMGGSIPGSVGFTYARTGDVPSNGKHAKKTKASAENGKEMQYYQEGLDWKPKMISRDGGWLDKYPDGGNVSLERKWLENDANMSPQERAVIAHQNELGFGDRMANEAWSSINTVAGLTPAFPWVMANEAGRNLDKGDYTEAAIDAAMGVAPYAVGKAGKYASKVIRENLKKGVTPLGYTKDAILDIPENIRRVNRGQEKILPKYIQAVVEKDPDLKRIATEMLPLREDAYGTYLGTQQGGSHMIPTGIDPTTGMDRYKLLSREHSSAEARDLSNEITGQIKGMKSQGPAFAVDNQFGVMGGHSRFISPDEKSVMYRDKWDLQPFQSSKIPVIKDFEVSSVIPGAKPFISEGKIADIKTKYIQQTPYVSMQDAIKNAYQSSPKWEVAENLNEVEYHQLTQEIEKDVVKLVKQLKSEGWKPIGYQPTYKQSFEYADINPYINIKSKFEDGGNLSPKQFTLDLINSPKYKERLSGMGYTNPAASAKTRWDAVNRTKLSYQDDTPNPEQIKLLKASNTPYSTEGSRYKDNTIVMDRAQTKAIGSSDEAIQSHEWSHPETQDITNRGFEVPGLNTNERNLLMGKLKPEFKNPKSGNKVGAHDLDPTENKADMNALRYQLQKKGIDVINKDINMQDLQNLKNSNDFSTKRLFEHYEDKDLLYLLNHIADNQKADPNKRTAKNGSQLTKLDQLTNFTNYNKPTAGGWLDKYKRI